MNNFVVENKKVLLLGVGGISMNQLAQAYLKLCYEVFGYDAHKSAVTDKLKSIGVKIAHKFINHFLSVDFCVATGAIKKDNPYIIELKKLNIPVIDRSMALGSLLTNFKCVIAVAGTHGKSTTSALIYEILKSAGKKVSCHIGAEVESPRFELGDDYVVVEACEYNKSFLNIYPDMAVVTNVEPEHLDCYIDFKNLQNAFSTFLKRAKKRFVFDEQSTNFLKKYKNINFITKKPHKSALKGEYNQKNISIAECVCLNLGISQNIIDAVIESFSGLPRRYEYIGQYGKTKVYIDYAHHPTEVKSFISAFSEEYKNSLVIFQPHTYSRTKMFFEEFVELLSSQKNICVFKEYPAREKKTAGVDAKTLFEAVKCKNKNCKYLSSIQPLKKLALNYDAIAFVGAGDIEKFAKQFVR